MIDSIVAEVRANRTKHAASFDNDLDRIYEDLIAHQNKHASEGWEILPPPANFQMPNPAPQRTRFVRR